MERRPVQSLVESRIYYEQLGRIRYQLQLLHEDYNNTTEIFARASLETDIVRLRGVETALLKSINDFLAAIGRPLVV